MVEAEAAIEAHGEQERAHRRYTRIDHPEVPRRLQWLEKEIKALADGLFDTRMELENAMGQGWERADATWADRGYQPARPGPAFEGDDHLSAMMRDLSARAIERAAMEHDLGPDLGIDL